MTAVRTFLDLVERQGRELGERIFIHAPDTKEDISFSSFAEAVHTFGAALRTAGLHRGTRVATFIRNGANAATTLIAIMAAGGTAIPLSPRMNWEERERFLQLSGAELLIAERGHSLAEDHPFHLIGNFGKSESLLLWDRKKSPAQQSGAEAPAESDPVLILFTSGTTGTSKGVVLNHRNLLANATAIRTAHELTSEDVALCILPLCHINGFVMTLVTPLLTGIPVVIPEKFEVKAFWQWVAHYRVTWFSGVPTILSLLLSGDIPQPAERATLRFARSASAPLPVALHEEFEHCLGIPVIESMGMSEAGGQVTSNLLPPRKRKAGSAGMPIGNKLQIQDDEGRELSSGMVGEVAIHGENVFSGYLDNPEADKKAFRNGWFLTGDLGYLDEEGYLFLTGRRKEIINRAGEKISPREVEEVIHRLPEVETVGVVGVPHRLFGEEVVAFVTLRPGASSTEHGIIAFCRAHLSHYKAPKEIFFIAEFPKGPNGKVQKHKLVDVYATITNEKQEEKCHEKTVAGDTGTDAFDRRSGAGGIPDDRSHQDRDE